MFECSLSLSLLPVFCVGLYNLSLLLGTSDISVLVIKVYLQQILSQKTVIRLSDDLNHSLHPVGIGIIPITVLVFVVGVLTESLLTQSLSNFVLAETFFPPQNNGVITHTYFCVLQSSHPESRHGDKTWTTGPRDTCSLFCHRHHIFNPFLCNSVFTQSITIYIMYI